MWRLTRRPGPRCRHRQALRRKGRERPPDPHPRHPGHPRSDAGAVLDIRRVTLRPPSSVSLAPLWFRTKPLHHRDAMDTEGAETGRPRKAAVPGSERAPHRREPPLAIPSQPAVHQCPIASFRFQRWLWAEPIVKCMDLTPLASTPVRRHAVLSPAPACRVPSRLHPRRTPLTQPVGRQRQMLNVMA